MTARIEDPVVRQYRYLLATSSADALQAAHLEALEGLTDSGRGAVLRAVQDSFVAGDRLRPEDTAAVARLLVHGERRLPGEFRRACEPHVLGALAAGVVTSDAAFGLLTGYEDWDGEDRAPADPGVDHGGGRGRDDTDPAAQAWAHARAFNSGQFGIGAGPG
jgi:hypothetical protein